MFFEPLESREMFAATIAAKLLPPKTPPKLPAATIVPVQAKPAAAAVSVASKEATKLPDKLPSAEVSLKAGSGLKESNSLLEQRQTQSGLSKPKDTKLPGNLLNVPTDPVSGKPLIGELADARAGLDGARSSFLNDALAQFGRSLHDMFGGGDVRNAPDLTTRPDNRSLGDFVTAELDKFVDQYRQAKGDETSQASAGSVWDTIVLGWKSFWEDEDAAETATEAGVAVADGETGDAAKAVAIEVGKKAADLDEKESAVVDFVTSIAETGAGAVTTLISATIATAAVALGADTSNFLDGVRAVSGQSGDKDPRMPNSNGTRKPDPNSPDGGDSTLATQAAMAQFKAALAALGMVLRGQGSVIAEQGKNLIAQPGPDGEGSGLATNQQNIDSIRDQMKKKPKVTQSAKDSGVYDPADDGGINTGEPTGTPRGPAGGGVVDDFGGKFGEFKLGGTVKGNGTVTGPRTSSNGTIPTGAPATDSPNDSGDSD
jgi:hypothetical protein